MFWFKPTFSLALPVVVALCLGLTPARAGEYVVKSINVPDMKAVFGQVESAQVIAARARISGSIHEIRITEGDQVKQGQIVAIVIDDKLALELHAADARIEALNAQFENARTELDRAQQLLARGAGTQARVDQARTQYDVIVSQITAARAEKAVVEQRAHEGEVLAPADGRVLTVPVTLGSVVLAGEEIARIASGRYYLRLSLPERHAAQIRQDTLVRIGRRGLSMVASAGLTETGHGRIAKVYPEIVGGRVIADVEVDDIGDYFVNERTLVWIPVAERLVISVPSTAVTTRYGIDYVRIAAGDASMDVAVILGDTLETHDGARVEVLTGLRDGDRIVTPGP